MDALRLAHLWTDESPEARWYAVQFVDGTAGLYPFTGDDAEVLRAHPGVRALHRLREGAHLLDPLALQVYAA